MIRIERDSLIRFATYLLQGAGMEQDKACIVADILVEGDLIGHETHGVSLIPWYLDALASGELCGSGSHDIVADRGPCFTWNGRHLPGAWLISQALNQACERVAEFGVVTAVISNSHHTCALAAYLRQVTERGYVAQISVSNPAAARMAPYGGTAALLTPNPIAAGFPTSGDPVLIDISSSISTTTMTQNLAARGERFPENWALTAQGLPTDDPAEVVHYGGSLMPLGGTLKGHKGYGLALMVELLGQGLSGHGRADAPSMISQAVFIQVMDPQAFAGAAAFVRQSDFITDTCRTNPPAPGQTAVRVPGDRAAAKRRQALNQGVPLAPSVFKALQQRASILGVAMPPHWPPVGAHGAAQHQ